MASTRSAQAETDAIAALLRRVTELERQVTEMRAARRLAASAIDASEGSLRVVDGGVTLLQIGNLGEPYHGTQVRRRTGHLAMTAWSTSPTDPGFVAPLWDLSGNYVITDDVESQRGLARPYLQTMMADSLSIPTSTSNTANTSIAFGVSALENPVLLLNVLYRSSAADTTGQLQLAIDNVLTGPTLTIPANTFLFGTIGPFAHGITSYGVPHNIDLMIRRTAGTGTVGARVLNLIGLESSFV